MKVFRVSVVGSTVLGLELALRVQGNLSAGT